MPSICTLMLRAFEKIGSEPCETNTNRRFPGARGCQEIANCLDQHCASFETAAARPPQDEELSQFYQRLPHAEERPLRDAACGGSSGPGARLEARTDAMQPIS